jgi:predicted nucleic acid-binding protein
VTYLLDTDVSIDWLSGATPPATQSQLLASGIAISVITLMELLEGVRNEGATRISLDTFLEGTAVHSIDPPTAQIAASIRRRLRQRRVNVGHRALDILIAATAIEHELTLVTRNARHFDDIEGLALY